MSLAVNRRGFFGAIAALAGLVLSGRTASAQPVPAGPLRHMVLFMDGDRVLFEREMALAEIEQAPVIDAPVELAPKQPGHWPKIETWRFQRAPLPTHIRETRRVCVRYHKVASLDEFRRIYREVTRS